MVKVSLKKTLGRAFVTQPVLQTTIVEVEAIINDRPLTYLSSTIGDPQPLKTLTLIVWTTDCVPTTP